MRLELLPDLVRLGNAFETAGSSLYAVGGWVRDRVLGRPVYDLDVASPAETETVLQLAEKEPGLTAEVRDAGLASLTLKWQTEGGQITAEFTSFRRENCRRDGTHRPSSVSQGVTLEEDALRRDFTVNAMYCRLTDGEVLDPTGGLTDLDAGLLRTPRDPDDVFSEDALRLLRLARFASELSFEPDAGTLAGAVRQAKGLINLVPARIGQELSKILLSDLRNPSDPGAVRRGLEILRKTNADKYLFSRPPAEPELVAAVPPRLCIRLAALLGNFNAQSAEKYCLSLGLGRATAADTAFLIANRETRPEKPELFLAEIGYARAEALTALWTAQDPERQEDAEILKRLKKDGIPDSQEKLALNGREIADALRLSPGPVIGVLKRKLWEAVVQRETVNTAEELRNYLIHIQL